MKTCAICGAEIINPRRRKYCSAECALRGKYAKINALSSQRPRGPAYCERICAECGVRYMGYPKSKRCPACQREVDLLHHREANMRRKLGKTRPIGSIAYCVVCGAPYTVNGGGQKYCPGCKQVATLEAVRAQSREHNRKVYADPEKREQKNAERRVATTREAVCPTCGKTFIAHDEVRVFCSAECAATDAKYRNHNYHIAHKSDIYKRKKIYRIKERCE